jgi:hypothetical protein
VTPAAALLQEQQVLADHTPLPVSGYTAQSQAKVDEVNINKRLEEVVLRRLDDMKGMSPDFVDARWLAVGRTHIEEVFMAINRAIFRPERVKIDE